MKKIAFLILAVLLLCTVIFGAAVSVSAEETAGVFGLGGFLLGRKKKKPALASGENKDEE